MLGNQVFAAACQQLASGITACIVDPETLQLGDTRGHTRDTPDTAWLPEMITAYLGGGNSNIFYFHPHLGKIPSLTNIFQMG